MSKVFPKQSRAVALRVLLGVGILACMSVAAVGYYVTPKYTRVGYSPQQPIAFSHQLHVGTVGLDCLHCHSHVGDSPHANIPATQVCLNCHDQTKGNIKSQSAALEPLREAAQTGNPVEWVKVHRVPDYAYFNHAVHVKRGVGCVSCHGKVNEMPVVRHDQPLSMSWCLDCHRNPAPNIRPVDKVTDLNWAGVVDGKGLVEKSGIVPPTNCTGCHR